MLQELRQTRGKKRDEFTLLLGKPVDLFRCNVECSQAFSFHPERNNQITADPCGEQLGIDRVS